jgi:hypothetical protein
MKNGIFVVETLPREVFNTNMLILNPHGSKMNIFVLKISQGQQEIGLKIDDSTHL